MSWAGALRSLQRMRRPFGLDPHPHLAHACLERVLAAAGLALGQAADPVGQDDAALGGRRRHRALLLHRHGGVALDPGDDPAAGRVQVRPPAVIVVAEIEDVGGAGLDRHRLGGRQVGDAGRRHRGVDRLAGVGIKDDVSLGAAHRGRKARPPPAQRAEPDESIR